MLAALLRYPRAQRSEIARTWGLRAAAARVAREPDLVTLRKRALHDRRGQIIREGVTYCATGHIRWCVRHAVAGRSNQVEIVVNGRVWRRCSLRSALAYLQK